MVKSKQTKLLTLFLALILALTVIPLNAAAAEEPITLTIIHINDRHGRMDADPYISQLAKDAEGNVLILDAGDTLHGQTTTNLSEGEAMVELMNAVGYNAMTPGNHDFNFGVDRLSELSEMMDFPLLAANVKTADGKLLFKPYEIFTMDGLTVGVFGLVTPETIAKSDPRIVAGLTFETPATVAADMVGELQAEGCDIIIALTHLGVNDFTESQNQSKAVAAVPGIDVVIDGHSHTAITEPVWVGDTLIAQAGWSAEHIGVVEITIRNSVKEKLSFLIQSPFENHEPDEAITTKIAELDANSEAITSAVVGHTPVLLQGEREYVRKEETNLANVITDSMRWATGADVAFVGGGNIRASIGAGDITMGQVLTVLPFSNLLVTVELTGADLLAVLEHGVAEYPELDGAHIQVSGLSFTFDPDTQPGQRVNSVTMPNGVALNPDKVYTVATIEYIASGGDGYDMLANGQNLVYYGGDAEALADYLATNPEIKTEPEWRVKTASTDEASDEPAPPIEPETQVTLENPKTGDSGWIYAALIIAVLSLALVITITWKKRRTEK